MICCRVASFSLSPFVHRSMSPQWLPALWLARKYFAASIDTSTSLHPISLTIFSLSPADIRRFIPSGSLHCSLLSTSLLASQSLHPALFILFSVSRCLHCSRSGTRSMQLAVYVFSSTPLNGLGCLLLKIFFSTSRSLQRAV